MNDAGVQLPSSVRWMRIFAGLVIVGAACYSGFMALERTGDSATMRGAVLDKRHVAAHKTYVTEIINGRSVVVPRVVDDAYVVDLALAGDRATGVVEPELFTRLSVGDSVTVEVRRRRLSRAIDVLHVSR